MAAQADLSITSLRGGLNDTDPPSAISDDQCTQAQNVEFFYSMCGERRAGCATLALTSSGLTTETSIVHLSQWFPSNVVTSPEFIAISATPSTSVKVAYRDTSAVWHVITPNDAINNTAPDIFQIVAQPLNGVDFIACRTSVDRLHLWDGSSWRSAGLTQPAAPTGANQGSGNYAGKRYFRVRYVVLSGTTVLRRSEPSTSLAFTPSGTGASVRVTKPTTISEGETHWELEASEDDANYYRIARTAVATTTYDDTTASSKSFPAPRGAGAPVSTDGTSITYVLLSDQAAALALTGTLPTGSYGTATIAGRGWIGYTSADVLIPSFPTTWTAGTKWYASPCVATGLEAAASDDSGNYAAIGTLSDAVGAYLLIPSAKYLAVDGDRLIYGGHWTDATKQSTVGWTPVKNDPGVGNGERAPIVTTGGDSINTTADLDNYDGGPLTGLAAASYGVWYAFKWQRIYSGTRTDNVARAYDVTTANPNRGAIPGSIIRAADADGSVAIFFLDPYVGPCRLSAGGVVTAIRGLRTTWERVNIKATSVICCGVYYPYKQQVKWWLSVDGGNTPTLEINLQTSELRTMPDGSIGRGWSTATGKIATAQCAAALTYTVGNLTTDVPFIGLPSPDFVQRCDTGTDDNGTAFTGTITSKPFFWAGLLNKWGVMAGGLLATADADGSIKMTLIRDEGLETVATAVTSLAPSASEAEVVIPFDDLALSGLRSLQVKLTDGTAAKNWQAQRVDLKPRREESA